MTGIITNPPVHILYAEDDAPSGRLLRSIAEGEGCGISVVATGAEFLKALRIEKPDIVLLDLSLPDASGLDLLAKSRVRLPATPVIVVTASESVNDVITALKGGAIDYITKPVDYQRLVVSLANAVKMMRQQQDLTSLRSELKEVYRLEHMIGNSATIMRVRDLIRQAAPEESTVLVMGKAAPAKNWWPRRCITPARDRQSLLSTSIARR